MNDFDTVLEKCVQDLEHGASSVDQCLARHPKHAAALRPILLSHEYMLRGRRLNPSPAFKARVRANLIREMRAQPRRRSFSLIPFMRLATSFAVIISALFTVGTAYAQSAMPGEPFYSWKLASEDVWQAVSPDPVETELAIARRRLNELITVSDDPALRDQTLDKYLETVTKLRSNVDAKNEGQILPELESQAKKLKDAGISVPQAEPDPKDNNRPDVPPGHDATPGPQNDRPDTAPTKHNPNKNP